MRRFIMDLLASLKDGCYIEGLWAFLALTKGKLHFLSFAQRLETLAANGTVVHEHVFTLLALDEAEPLTLIEPLTRTGFAF